MKKLVFLLFLAQLISAQTPNYQRHNIELLAVISPNKDTLKKPGENQYSGCWGWYQASKNKEYAISGTSNGTYFIDVSVPTSPSVCAFVPGKPGGTWREMKTYQNYCYITSDDAQPNKFTIVDMQYLPDSVHIVHYGNKYFERGHTIYIDQDKMYIGATTYSSGSSAMTVWSLATPTNPVLLRRAEQDIPPPVFSYVHDMFVRNDTVYASTGFQGLHVLKLDQNNTFSYLGSYQGYPKAGYNHSSWLTQDGKYLAFCDEVPTGIPINLVDVRNLGNIQPVTTFIPYHDALPHNPYIIGNKFCVVSCYQDGLQIYDISNPALISQAGYFDTYPQGGVSAETYHGSHYAGNWGAYPFLPSGIIIANDMQNGVFILDAKKAFSTTVINPVGVTETPFSETELSLSPNPANERVDVTFNYKAEKLEVSDIQGRIIFSKELAGTVNETIAVKDFKPGTYIVTISGSQGKHTKKLIIQH